MATTTLTESKVLQPQGSPIGLRITVGFSQAGGSFVVLTTPQNPRTEIFPDANGVYQINVSPGSILTCITTVQDINLSTNNTSVTHDFTMIQPSQHFYQQNVQHQNDRVVYDVTYFML